MTKTQGTEGKCPRNSGERESRVGVSREKCQRLLVFLSIPSAQRAPGDQDVYGRCDLDPRPPLPGPSLALRTGRRSSAAEPKWRETSGGFSLPLHAVEGPEKCQRGGSASPRPAPLRPTPCVPSPSATGKAAAGAAANCGAGGRGRGVARRPADEMRALPLWAAVLVLGALAGVGVGGE